MGFMNRIIASTFRAMLTEWFLCTSLPEARKFLEKNLQLLRPESEQILAMIVQQFIQKKNSSNEEVAKLLEVRDSNLSLLRRAIAAGKTRQVVRDAYIDKFSALRALDLPSWLSQFTRSLTIGWYIVETDDPVPASMRDAEGNLVQLLQGLIVRTRASVGLEREILADLQLLQGTLLMEENAASAIELLTEAARVFCWQRFPKRFALVRKNLGLSYCSILEQKENNDDEDVLSAIVCLEAALGYYTPEIDMKEWCKQKFYLAECYDTFEDYDHTRQILHELLSTLPPSRFPELFQAAQKILRELEESQQRQEHFTDSLDLSMPEVIEMHRNHHEQDLEEKRNKLQYFREKFSQLCGDV